jgi:AraC family transcriptional regulator, transcriptional activator for feuABC-ybbA operon
MNYDYLSKFHPKLLDIVVRDQTFWQRFNYNLLRKSTQLHTIGLVYEGKGTLSLDDQRYALTPGSIFQIIPGCYMSIKTGQQDTLHFYSVHYSAHLSDESGQDFEIINQGLPFPIHSTHADWQPLYQLFQSAWHEWNNKQPGYEWRCKISLFAVIDEIVRLESGISAGNGMEHIIQYMNEHYSDPLNRSQLAARAGWSPTYFSTLFKEQTGQSPIQYLNKLRIDRAKQLLRSTSMPITQIAADVGFTDSFYFARIFTKSTGFSPSEYRKA